MDYKKSIKTIVSLLVLLVLIQLSRMCIEHILFSFITRTHFTYSIVSMIAMLVLTIIFIAVTSIKQIALSIFPQKFGLFYIIATLLFIGVLITSPDAKTKQTIFLMFYSRLVTPIFEEIIFRGYLWNRLNTTFNKEYITYIVSTLLFAVWHLGYFDVILFRSPPNFIVIMFWKMVVGLCFGIVLGAVRLKTKNCYSTILLHGLMNIFSK